MRNPEITTNTLKKGVAESNPVIILKSAEMRILFHPLLHLGGVRGSIVKYKKDKKSDWKDLKTADFKSHPLGVMEKVEISLTTEEITTLVEAILSRDSIVKEGIKSGTHDYVTVEKEKIVAIDDTNKRDVIKQLLEKGYSDDFWEILSHNAPDLADKLTAGRIQTYRKSVVNELKARLKKNYPETSGVESWQNWIYQNSWLFGSNYEEPIEKQRLTLNGIMPDYLFPTIDGFVDVLEIKLPSTPVIVEDNSHKGSWKWSTETNEAIGQVVTYLSEIDRLRREIEANIETEYGKKLVMLKPRAYILVGNSENWESRKKEGLRKLNHSLHGIEIITYHQLYNRGETFVTNSLPELSKDTIYGEDIPF